MNRTSILFFIFPFCFIASGLYGQNDEDMAFARSVVKLKRVSGKSFKTHTEGTKGLWSGIASGTFLFYKANVSSQDSRRCMYDLSCSAYAMESIRARGFWQGWLLGLDRYTRCNGMHGIYYTDAPGRREHDPILKRPAR